MKYNHTQLMFPLIVVDQSNVWPWEFNWKSSTPLILEFCKNNDSNLLLSIIQIVVTRNMSTYIQHCRALLSQKYDNELLYFLWPLVWHQHNKKSKVAKLKLSNHADKIKGVFFLTSSS